MFGRRRLRSAIPGLILFVGLLLTVIGTLSAQRARQAEETFEFANLADSVRYALEGRLDAYIAMLRGGAGLFAASEDVSLEEFRAYVSRLELPIHYPGIQGIGFSQVVKPADRERVASAIRSAGLPFEFWPPQGDDETLHAIVYLEPLDTRNIVALGYNMFTESTRRAAMERARDTGEPAASGVVRLVQERAEPGREQPGFLIYMPVYGGGDVPEEPARTAQLTGFVYSPFRAADLLNSILARYLEEGLDIEVFDAGDPGDEPLYRSKARAEAPTVRVGERTTTVAGRQWRVVIRALPRAGIGYRDLFVWFIAAGGVLFSTLLYGAARTEMRAREEAEGRANELRESEEALRHANQAKDDFLAVVSHELRTPLNAILGWSSMLMRGQVPADQQATALATIQRNARTQVKLVEDLLDMSRAVTGRLRLDFRETDIAAVLRASLQAMHPMAEAGQVRLEWQGAPHLGVISADPDRLQQIVVNLLTNAIKFTPPGGVVSISARREWREVVIEVHDNGMGIPAELLPHVFEPFRQGDPSTTRAHGGVGLGLAIVKHLVELHGGSVQGASAGRAQGATFIVRLPEAPPRGRQTS